MLKTSSVDVGKLSKKKQYDYKTRTSIEVNRFDELKDELKGENHFISSNAIGDAYHRNYMEYLEICWSDHLGAVLLPDILWQALLCEFALIVKESPESFRHIFTISKDKQEISIYSDSVTEMPMSTLISAMKDYVPTNIDEFIPTFSTSTQNSLDSFRVAFADLASPYYDYSTYMCGIPYVDVRGTIEDYKLVLNTFINLVNTLNIDNKISEWGLKTLSLISQICSNLQSEQFWSDIFRLKKCGSGSQVEVEGWWSKLFRRQPSVRFTYNFDTHLSVISYKELNTNLDYVMNNGLISSVVQDDLLVPEFGNIIFVKL